MTEENTNPFVTENPIPKNDGVFSNNGMPYRFGFSIYAGNKIPPEIGSGSANATYYHFLFGTVTEDTPMKYVGFFVNKNLFRTNPCYLEVYKYRNGPVVLFADDFVVGYMVDNGEREIWEVSVVDRFVFDSNQLTQEQIAFLVKVQSGEAIEERSLIYRIKLYPSDNRIAYVKKNEDVFSGGIELSDDIPLGLGVGIASAGTSVKASRSDHKHFVEVNVPTGGLAEGRPIRDGGTITESDLEGSLGTSENFSRRDHFHPLNYPFDPNDPNYEFPLPKDVGSEGAHGDSKFYAAADHVHKGAGGSVGGDTPLPNAAIGVIGVSEFASHSDHVHPAELGDPTSMGNSVPLVDFEDGITGLAVVASREDHQHPLNVGDIAPPVEIEASAGVSTVYARADHAHFIPSDGTTTDVDVVPEIDKWEGNIGVSSVASREDHQHKINTDTVAPEPVAEVALSSKSIFLSETPIRTYAIRDHVHAGVVLPPKIGSVAGERPGSGAAMFVGISDKASRADHSHYIPLPFLLLHSNEGATPLPDMLLGAFGSSTEGARRDHQHQLNVDDINLPKNNAATAVIGSSTAYAKSDHVHVGGAGSALHTSVPLADGVGVVGNAQTASPGNHVHPANIGTDIKAVGAENKTGTSLTYAASDHIHKSSAGELGSIAPDHDIVDGSSGGVETTDVSKEDHRHKLNVDDSVVISDVGDASASGDSPFYARVDHTHKGLGPPINPGTSIDSFRPTQGAAGTAPAVDRTWTYNGTTGAIIRQITRVYYDYTTTTPRLYGYYRDMTFSVGGVLYAIGPEVQYIIDQPIKVTLSTGQ